MQHGLHGQGDGADGAGCADEAGCADRQAAAEAVLATCEGLQLHLLPVEQMWALIQLLSE